MSKIGYLLLLLIVTFLIETQTCSKLLNVKKTNSSNEETTRIIFRNKNSTKHYNKIIESKLETLPKKNISVKINRKRCRYSDHDIEVMNKNNLKSLNNFKKQPLNNYDEVYDSGYNYFKQPKVRDQYHNRHNHPASHSIEPHYEKEVLYVNIGDTINLTCHVNTKEVDWHFKDKNLTTTIISYGLQLQISQAISLNQNKFKNYDFDSDQNLIVNSNELISKYKVTSDRQYVHTLSLYIQGSQDEGSYQCIDSKSESPIKKSIYLYLKNHARALTSGYETKRIFSSVYYYLILFNILIYKNCFI